MTIRISVFVAAQEYKDAAPVAGDSYTAALNSWVTHLIPRRKPRGTKSVKAGDAPKVRTSFLDVVGPAAVLLAAAVVASVLPAARAARINVI